MQARRRGAPASRRAPSSFARLAPPQVDTFAWRPLLHRAACRGDVALTEELLAQMESVTGKAVFDSLRHRLRHASNYRILARGVKDGFDAAEAALRAARDVGAVDPLSYAFLFDVAIGTKHSEPRGAWKPDGSPNEVRLAHANRAWEMMAEDGIRPSISLCHRMFGVWAGNGQIERAEEAFDAMRTASAELLASSHSLAQAWEQAATSGGDLAVVAESLEAAPLVSLGHSFMSYVNIIQANIDAAAPPQRVAAHVAALRTEAAERKLRLPWPIAEALLKTLVGQRPQSASSVSFGGRAPPASRTSPPLSPPSEGLLDIASELHSWVATEGGRPPPGGTVALVAALMAAGRLADAAQALLCAGDVAPRDRRDDGSNVLWSYGVLQQKYEDLRAAAADAPADAPAGAERTRLEEVLGLLAPLYDPQPQPVAQRKTPATAQAPAPEPVRAVQQQPVAQTPQPSVAAATPVAPAADVDSFASAAAAAALPPPPPPPPPAVPEEETPPPDLPRAPPADEAPAALEAQLQAAMDADDFEAAIALRDRLQALTGGSDAPVSAGGGGERAALEAQLQAAMDADDFEAAIALRDRLHGARKAL